MTTSDRVLTPRNRRSRNRGHTSSMENTGSPEALIYDGPFILPWASTLKLSAYKPLRQRYSGPSPSKAAQVVTSFITEAGLRGVSGLIEISSGPSSSWTTRDRADSGRPVFCQAVCKLAGSDCAQTAALPHHNPRKSITPKKRCAVTTEALSDARIFYPLV